MSYGIRFAEIGGLIRPFVTGRGNTISQFN